MEKIIVEKWRLIPAIDERKGVPVRKRHMRVEGVSPSGDYRVTARVRTQNGTEIGTWRVYDHEELPWPDEPEEIPEGDLQIVTLGIPHHLFLETLADRGILLNSEHPFAFMDDGAETPDDRVPVVGDKWN
jgi:hypothetical protein